GGLSQSGVGAVEEALRRISEIANRLGIGEGEDSDFTLERPTLQVVERALDEGRRPVIRGERVPDNVLDPVFLEWLRATKYAEGLRQVEGRPTDAGSKAESWAELAERLEGPSLDGSSDEKCGPGREGS
ncbi:MAG: hypothetical protein ABGY09_07815, partial [Euryarchaeota archaeon]